MNKLILPAVVAVFLGSTANAQVVTFGSLSSIDDGVNEIITDSLNDYEWLRWDELAHLNYEETRLAIGSGGAYEGWSIATHVEAQLFTDALLSGLTNDCTATGYDICNNSAAVDSDLETLTGENYAVVDGLSYAWFLNDAQNGTNDAGLIRLFQQPQTTPRIEKDSDIWNFDFTDRHSVTGNLIDHDVTWLLYRDVSAVPEVSATGAVAAFGTLLALMAFLFERRGREPEDTPLAV